MTFKTIFIIVVSVLVTIVLMNNTEEISFWVFTEIRIPKLIVLGVIFLLGLLIGFMLGSPRKKSVAVTSSSFESEQDYGHPKSNETEASRLSDDDREYLR